MTGVLWQPRRAMSGAEIGDIQALRVQPWHLAYVVVPGSRSPGVISCPVVTKYRREYTQQNVRHSHEASGVASSGSSDSRPLSQRTALRWSREQ